MDERSLLDLVYSAHQLLGKLESTARDYGTGDFLYSSDIHTVVEVARRPGCNLTQLAGNLRVSKPAAFKFVKKMLALKYLIKERAPDNKKEVLFTLSEKGKTALELHAAYVKQAFEPLVAIEKGLSHQDHETVKRFLLGLEKACSWE